MIVIVVARVILIGVFAVAGISKACDGPGTRRAAIGFGVPERVAGIVARTIPALELLTAVLLLGPATAQAGGVAALVLLAVFSCAIGVNLAKGRKPACACFGRVSSEPVGARLLVRNGALALLSVVVIAGGSSSAQPSLWAELQRLSGVEQVLALAVAALAALVWALALRVRSMQRELVALGALVAQTRSAPGEAQEPSPPETPHETAVEAPAFPPGLPVGSAAPDLALSSVDDVVSLRDLWSAGKPLVVLFVAPTCGTCHALVPKPATWATTYGDVLSFVLVTAGDARANAGIEERTGGFGPVLFDPGPARQRYEVAATPAGVVVGRDGTIETETVYGVPEITMLVMRAAGTERSLLQAKSSVV